MKIAFIIVRTELTSKKMVADVVQDLKALKRKNGSIYIITNVYGKQGYAEGVNNGIREAQKDNCDLFVILNPDIRIKKMNGADLLAPGATFDVWGYAMKQDDVTYYKGILDAWRLSAGLSSAQPQDRFIEAPFVSGSFMCIKKEVIEKIGLWDEGYFMYYDEVDYCVRAKKAGFKVGVDTGVSYDHLETSREYAEKNKWIARSRIRFFLKYANQLQQLYELVRLPKTLFEERRLFMDELKKRPFLTNFLSLNASSAVNKILTFFLFIVLVRHLSIAEYGLYTLAWAHIGLTMPIADFGTTSYGIIRYSKKSLSDFNDMYTLRWILGSAMVFVTMALAYIFRYNSLTIAVIALLIPAMIYNIVSGSLLIYSASQSKSYISSIVSVGTNAILIVVLIALLVLSPTSSVLLTIFGATAICYSVFVIIAFGVLKNNFHPLSLHFNVNTYRHLLKKASIFVLLSFFAGLYFKADVLLLNAFKGAEAVGIYSSGYKFFEALIFIAASYTIAATPVYSMLLKENVKGFVQKLYRDSVLMFLLGTGIAGVLMITAPALLSWILKDQYAGALPVFRTVMIALPFLFASTVFMNTFYILKKTHIIVSLFLVQALLNGFLNAYFIPLYSYHASASITVFTEILTLVILITSFVALWPRWRVRLDKTL